MVALRDRLALLFGLWTASVLAPPVAFALGGPFDGSPTLLDGTVTAGLFVFGGLVARTGLERIGDPAERFREGVEMAGGMAVGGVVLFGAAPVAYVYGVVAAVPFGVGGAVGFVTGLLIGYVADQAVVARSRASSEFRLEWSAKKQPSPRSRRRRAIDILGTVLGFWMAASTALDRLWPYTLFWLAITLLIGREYLPLLRRRRQYELTDDGLIGWIGHIPWEKFDSYSVTEEAVVLNGNVWPFGTLAFDRGSIDDADAVIDALDGFLPRQEGSHDDPSPMDNFRQALGSD